MQHFILVYTTWLCTVWVENVESNLEVIKGNSLPTPGLDSGVAAWPELIE